MESQILFGTENVKSLRVSYIAIPVEALNISNQEVQSILSQNVTIKSLSDNQVDANTLQNCRPTVIEYSSNSEQNVPQKIPVVLPQTSQDYNFNEPKYEKEKLIIKNKDTKQNFRCNICSKKFKNKLNYEYHIHQHNQKKKYQCNQCSESFNVQDNFKIHMAMHTKGEPTCPICSRKFQRLASLKSHLFLHQAEEVFTCNDCNVEFNNEDELSKHFACHFRKMVKNRNPSASYGPHTCNYCTSTFDTLREYKEHLSCHIKINRLLHKVTRKKRKSNSQKEQPHKCKECGKSFSKYSLLERHIRIHSGEKPFKCQECNRGFSQKGTLYNHMNMHSGNKPYECTLCPAKFCQKGNLRMHVEKTHTVSNPKEKMYKCNLCSCIFKKVAALNGHVTKAHSGKKCDDISVILNQLKELEKQTCSKTSQQNDKGNLANPLSNITTNVEKKRKVNVYLLRNEEFEYVSLTESVGDQEVRCHNVKYRKVGDIRWYMCSYCIKEFKKPSDLIRHHRVHTREKPFSCHICNQKFSLKSTLSLHINTHITEKHYKCKICDKTLSSAKKLYIHTRRHEKGEISNDSNEMTISCNICKHATFPDEISLKIHLRQHQKAIQIALNDTNKEVSILNQPLLTSEGLLKTSESNSDSSAIYSCSVCPASFSTKIHLKKHASLHNSDRKLKCETCFKSCPTLYTLKKHQKAHYNIKNHGCRVCGKKFVSLSSLNRHMPIHSTLKVIYPKIISSDLFSCSFCDKQFASAAQCKIHIDDQHKIVNYDKPEQIQIVLTNKEKEIIMENNVSQKLVFNQNKSKTENEQSTQKPMILQVEKNFVQNQNLELNQLNNNVSLINNSPMESVLIDYDNYQMKIIPSYELVTASLFQEKGITSVSNPETSNILFSVDTALNHLNQNTVDTFLTPHIPPMINDLISIQQSGGDQLQQICNQNIQKSTDICISHQNINLFNTDDYTDYNLHINPADTIINKKNDLTQHIEHPIKNVNEEKETVLVNNKNTEKSKINIPKDTNIAKGKTSPDITNLRKPSGYQCPSCYKTFTKKSTYVKHQTYHKKSRQINECQYCSKVFKKPSDLIRHLRTHTGERPFRCTLCDKRFSLKSTLNSHFKTHNPGGHKDFNCPVCNSFFSSRSSLRVHMFLHTGVKPYGCSSCPLKFRTTGQRQLHIKKHQKETKEIRTENCNTHNLDYTLREVPLVMEKIQEINEEREPAEIHTEEERNQLETAPTSQGIENVEQNNLDSSKTNAGDPLFYQLNFEENNFNEDSLAAIPVSFIQLDGDVFKIKMNPDDGHTFNFSDFIPPDSSFEKILENPHTDQTEKINYDKNTDAGNDFKCSICRKKLKNKKVLKKHMKIHERRKYFCDKCFKTFGFEMELTEHSQNCTNVIDINFKT